MLGTLESLVSTKRPGTREAGEAFISDDEQDGREPEQVLASGHLVLLPAAAQGTWGGVWGRVCRPSASIRLGLPGWGRARCCLFSWMCVKAFRPPAPCRTSHSRVSGGMRALSAAQASCLPLETHLSSPAGLVSGIQCVSRLVHRDGRSRP